MNATIIVPYYNASSTIGCCINAIKKQMEAEDELIIINDGSSEDHSRALEQFNQYKVFSHSKNKGAAKARNLGMEKASNETFVFVDADVMLQKGCLLALKNKLMSGADACFVVPSNAKHDNFFSDYKNLYMIDILTRNENDLNYIYGSCCALRSNVKNKSWPTKLKLIEDNVFGYELWNCDALIKKVTEASFVHMKNYTALTLIRNDFSVSFQFARFMIEKSRWSTLYTSSNFGHTDKKQKASVIIAALLMLTTIFSFTTSLVLFFCWFLLNRRLFKYLNKERKPLFVVFSIFWTYISHLVYFLGIITGFFWMFLSTLSTKGYRVEQD
jgi:glycosyltransferase involved in cell wall biosynthesis